MVLLFFEVDEIELGEKWIYFLVVGYFISKSVEYSNILLNLIAKRWSIFSVHLV